jgi:hypothetical protein
MYEYTEINNPRVRTEYIRVRIEHWTSQIISRIAKYSVGIFDYRNSRKGEFLLADGN